MNHQVLVGGDPLSSPNGKQDLHAVMENLQQDVSGVRQMHQINGTSISVVNDIHGVPEDHSRVADPMAVSNEDTLTMDEDISDMDGNQDVQVIAHQANLLEDTAGVITGNKNYPGQQAGHVSDLQLNEEGPLPMDTQHYYESLHPTPIMVYGVPAGSIVPFDSLVPLGKGIGDKHNEDDLLQPSVNEAVYTHSGQDMSHPLYVLHQPQKKEATSDGMVMDQINAGDIVSPNIVLENRDSNDFSKVGDHASSMMQSGTEFSLISTSCYDNSVTSVANMANLSMSAVYHSPTDTDSEVALTLASLGNPKIDKMETMDKDCSHNQGSEHSDVIRAASIISGVADHQQFENISHQTSNIITKEMEDKKHKPTLVLRSRRNRTTTLNHHHDLSIDDSKKGNKRKRKKETKSTYLKIEDHDNYLIPDSILPDKPLNAPGIAEQNNESQKENLLGQLLKASEHCEPATLIPEGVVDDVIPAVGYRIMDMSNLSEMIRMMHKCPGSMGAIVIQEQASLREGAVSQLSVICTGCQEGAVCATSNRTSATGPWDINARVEQLTTEFSIKEDQVQRMLEILGIFYRPCIPAFQPMPPPVEMEPPPIPVAKKKRNKKKDTDSSGKPKNLVCSICKERFAGENHLKKHMHSHDLVLHTCPYCHAYFKKPFNLKQHIKKHENCKYECNQCQRAFTDKSTLLCHIRSQHEKRYNIQCKMCPKRFYHRAHFNEHMRIHTGEKPYMCEVCGKKFSWHDSVKKHMQTHSAESKYKCRLCGKWFRWLQGVRQHLQQQHKLKKCDIEAQVVTAATETATGIPQFHHQPQPPPQSSQQQATTQHHQSHLNQGPHVLAHPQEENPSAKEYHTLEAAAPNGDNAAQQTLNIFHVSEVESQQQAIFQYS